MYLSNSAKYLDFTSILILFSNNFRDGKFVEAGNQFWFPDDVTLGYIIGNPGIYYR